MKNRIAAAAALGVCPMLCAGAAGQALPAFSGAEGPGATATGGRGGDVYHVTNLEWGSATPGSLAHGIATAPSAGRTIVFDVGGTIYNGKVNPTSADIFASGKSNITIAGQTAPGPGITIAGVGSKWSGSNVILRNITVRPNIGTRTDGKPPQTYDAFSLQLKNSIVDHVSATWYTDEGISLTDAGANTTVQYAYMNEGLNYNGHGYGSIIATETDGTHYSYHHNLYAHNNSRLPRLGSETGTTGAVLNFSNNVVYNWINKAGYSGTDQPNSNNFVNNYYVKGNNNGATIFSGGDADGRGGFTKIYQSGNVYDGDKDGLWDGAIVGSSSFAGGKTIVSTPFAVTGVGAADTAAVALQRVADYGGANWQNRHAIEQRIVASLRNGTGSVITAVPTGDWDAVLAQRTAVARAANFDTDRDGMPDAWEVAHGLNPTSAAGIHGNNGLALNDGYTNLEAYLNELAAWPAASTVVFSNGNGTGRFAEIRNWQGGVVKPSRFDAVQVNAGTATVDVVGQHARTLSVAAANGGNATLAVTGGWIDVDDALRVGPGGSGQVDQTGGVVRAGNAVVLGGSGQASAYNLFGGTLATGALTRNASNAAFNFAGGVLHADTIGFSLVNQGGTLAPGSDVALQRIAAASMPDVAGRMSAVRSLIGTTRVVGDLTLLSGTLQIDLASLASFDAIAVDGTLTLGGGLAVALVDGYEPADGSRWRIGTAGSIGGTFAAVTPGFSTQVVGKDLFLVAGPVPEPSALAVVGLAVVAAKRVRRRQ